MTENELHETLAYNIKRYRAGKHTQETLAEEISLSYQTINAIEGRRRFPSPETLVKLAAALGVEVYQLFVPHDTKQIVIEETPKNERIRAQITEEVVDDVRRAMTKALDKILKE